MKYFICEMKDAKNGLGIVSEAYYNNASSVIKHATNKKFTNNVVFSGEFNECVAEKKKLLR